MKVKKNIPVSIKITPKELAQIFWNAEANEQAEFFSELHKESVPEDLAIIFQLQLISESKKLTAGGRELMKQIGEYSNTNIN